MVAFADIDKFIDAPVKRYSSGMYVRLAFSVGAHLQPEILIVDEVLAVGDANFQKIVWTKCRMQGNMAVPYYSYPTTCSRLLGYAIVRFS